MEFFRPKERIQVIKYIYLFKKKKIKTEAETETETETEAGAHLNFHRHPAHFFEFSRTIRCLSSLSCLHRQQKYANILPPYPAECKNSILKIIICHRFNFNSLNSVFGMCHKGGSRGPGGQPKPPKNKAPAHKFYKIEVLEWQF